MTHEEAIKKLYDIQDELLEQVNDGTEFTNEYDDGGNIADYLSEDETFYVETYVKVYGHWGYTGDGWHEPREMYVEIKSVTTETKGEWVDNDGIRHKFTEAEMKEFDKEFADYAHGWLETNN